MIIAVGESRRMTRAEAIKLLVNATYSEEWQGNEQLTKAQHMAIEALEQEPNKWIPVTEELPKLNDDGVSDMVLLCWSDGQRTVGAYRGDRTFVGQAWPEAKDVRVTVTAWMLLPEPYEESEE